MNRAALALLGLAAVLAFARAAQAHDPEADAKARLEELMKKPWRAQNGFLDDFEAALDKARESKKPLIAYFTASYADLPAAQAIESGVLSSAEFKKFAETVVLFVQVDSGLPGKYDDLLALKGGVEVPYLVVLDEVGAVTAKVARPFDVKSFEKAVADAREFVALRAKQDKSLDEKVRVLVTEMDLGEIRPPVAKERAAALGPLGDAQKAAVADALFRLEIRSLAAKAVASYTGSVEAGEEIASMWKAGREPADAEHARYFFSLLADHAERAKNLKTLELSIEKLKARLGEEPESEELFDVLAHRRDELKRELDAAAKGAR